MLNLIEAAEAAHRDPSLVPNHLGTVDRMICDRIDKLDRLLGLAILGEGLPGADLSVVSAERDLLEYALSAYSHPTPMALRKCAWNPRYLEYCASHGHPDDPEGMLASDRERWPGGQCAGFIMWASKQASSH